MEYGIVSKKRIDEVNKKLQIKTKRYSMYFQLPRASHLVKLSLSESVTHLLVSASSEHCKAVAETHVTFLTDKDKDKNEDEDK